MSLPKIIALLLTTFHFVKVVVCQDTLAFVCHDTAADTYKCFVKNSVNRSNSIAWSPWNSNSTYQSGNNSVVSGPSVSNGYRILSFKPTENGVYQCTGNVDGKSFAVTVEKTLLNETENATLKSVSSHVIGTKGQNVRLQVQTSSVSSLQWYMKGNLLTGALMTANNVIHPGGDNLTIEIQNSTSAHEGVYKIVSIDTNETVYIRLTLLECSKAKYGINCISSCQCQNGGWCNSNGTCLCLPGYNGTQCEQACPSGLFGSHCSVSCSGQHGKVCLPDPVGCHCLPGVSGPNCEEVTPTSFPAASNATNANSTNESNGTIPANCNASNGSSSACQSNATVGGNITVNGNATSGGNPTSSTSVTNAASGSNAADNTTVTTITTAAFNTTMGTTLSPKQRKIVWCDSNYGQWNIPKVDNCLTPFSDYLGQECSFNIVNSTNGLFDCKDAEGKNPSNAFSNIMKLPGEIEKLGLQLARYFESWRTKTVNQEKYRKKRFTLNKMVFEAGVDFKFGDMKWPHYQRKDLFAKPEWNKRNDSILLPYASIPSGAFKYVFAMYDNLHDEVILEENVRLKEIWKQGHLISKGTYIDPAVETGLMSSDKYVLNSAIISLSVEPVPLAPVPSDIIITFWHKRTDLNKPICVYWQYLKGEKGTITHEAGYWTNYGMSVLMTNKTTTQCAANHLSTFAVLMKPIEKEPEAPPDPFTVATVGMTIVSILFLLVYLIAMFMLGCIRTQYSRTYICAALACFLSQVVFLYAMTKKDDWESCTSLAGYMQLFHTIVMTWMMLESVHQLSRIRYFFNESTNVSAFYNIIGWGPNIPIIVSNGVIVTTYGFPIAVTTSLAEFPYNQFESKLKYCWVYVKGFDMWFFAGPLVVLFMISAIIRIITYFEIRKHPERVKKDINYERAWKSLVGSIFFLPVIAVLWLMATFGVTEPEGEGGFYLICIPAMNLLVGILVFYFYFYKNDEVHDAVVEQIKIREKKKLMRYEHLKGLHMNVKYKPSEEEFEEIDAISRDSISRTDSIAISRARNKYAV